MSNKQNTTYICAWYSPRGFANEGAHLYGTLAQYRDYLDAGNRVDGAAWQILSRHKSLQAAQNAAEKHTRISKRCIAWGETDYTSAWDLTEAVASAKEYQARMDAY